MQTLVPSALSISSGYGKKRAAASSSSRAPQSRLHRARSRGDDWTPCNRGTKPRAGSTLPAQRTAGSCVSTRLLCECGACRLMYISALPLQIHRAQCADGRPRCVPCVPAVRPRLTCAAVSSERRRRVGVGRHCRRPAPCPAAREQSGAERVAACLRSYGSMMSPSTATRRPTRRGQSARTTQRCVSARTRSTSSPHCLARRLCRCAFREAGFAATVSDRVGSAVQFGA
jgi:hypothetical protein